VRLCYPLGAAGLLRTAGVRARSNFAWSVALAFGKPYSPTVAAADGDVRTPDRGRPRPQECRMERRCHILEATSLSVAAADGDVRGPRCGRSSRLEQVFKAGLWRATKSGISPGSQSHGRIRPRSSETEWSSFANFRKPNGCLQTRRALLMRRSPIANETSTSYCTSTLAAASGSIFFCALGCKKRGELMQVKPGQNVARLR
jgi:hypothetical protein